MTEPQISDEAVEVAARVLWRDAVSNEYDYDWDTNADQFRNLARIALAAAVPLLHQQWEAKAKAIEPPNSASRAGEVGSEFAAKGDRYFFRGRVRHRTRQSIYDAFGRVAACGISANEMVWLGTGSQDEYEHLSTLPLCTRCARVEASAWVKP